MDYRFFLLNSAGKFADVEEWNCVSDVAAMERAARCDHAYGAELWRGEQRLSTFSGPMATPAGQGHRI